MRRTRTALHRLNAHPPRPESRSTEQQWKSWTDQQPSHAPNRSPHPEDQLHPTKINTPASPRIKAKPCSKINDALRAAVVKISVIGKQFVHLSAGHSQNHAT